MNDRFQKQAELVPHDRLADLSVTVIGVGAIGRQVSLQLAALGVRRLQLIDFDTVEITNLSSQGFFADDLTHPKVEATAEIVRRIDPAIEINTITDRFRPKFKIGQVVFCCVDSISARSAIWRAASHRCRFWADGRMLGETIRTLAVGDDQGRAHYPSTLFAQSDAQVGSCTARSSIYSANIAAGLLIHQFTRWLRGIPISQDTTLSLLSGEWSDTT